MKTPPAHLRMKLSRQPISLLPIEPSEPETPNVFAISTALSTLLTTELFKWKVEQLELPESALADCNVTYDLFQFPPKDDLGLVARDPITGERQRRLSPEMRGQLLRTGKLSVDSLNFPGQIHGWEMNRWLLYGLWNIKEMVLDQFAVAAGWLIVSAPSYIIRNWMRPKEDLSKDDINLVNAFSSLCEAVLHFADLVFGNRRMTCLFKDVESRLVHVRRFFHINQHQPTTYARPLRSNDDHIAVARLKSQDGVAVAFRSCTHAEFEALPDRDKQDWSVSRLESSLVSQPAHIDTITDIQTVMQAAAHPAVSEALARVDKAWALERHTFKRSWLKLHASPNTPPSTLVSQLSEAMTSELLSLQLAALTALAETAPCPLPSPLVPLLVARFHLLTVCHQCGDAWKAAVHAHREEAEASLRQRHAFLARNRRWLDVKLSVATRGFAQTELAFKQHFARALLQTKQGVQACVTASYLLARDAEYCESGIEERARRRMQATLEPESRFAFQRTIILPRNWIIRAQTVQGKVRYSAQKYTEHWVDTRYPGWRFAVMRQKAMEVFKSGLWFLVVSLWCGPLSMQALLRPAPFFPSQRVDADSGRLVPDCTVSVQTMCSRLRALWALISESRRRFESAPDAGLLGKSVIRPFHLVWTYLLHAFAASLAILLLQPALTLLNLAVCLPLVLSWWAVAPALSLLHFLACALLYDPYSPSNRRFFPLFRVLLWDLLSRALLRSLLSLLTALVLLPLAALALALSSTLLALFRLLLDTFVYAAVILPFARVPVADSWVAKRTSGPGLSDSIVFQIKPEPVLLLLLSQLEQEELTLFEQCARSELEAPLRAADSCSAALHAAGLSLHCNDTDRRPDVQKALTAISKSVKAETKQLGERCEERRRLLPKERPRPASDVICLSPEDLATLFGYALPVVRSFATSRLAPYHASLDAFWASKQLPPGEWEQLTRRYLARVGLGAHLTRPLDHVAAALSLQVQHVDLGTWVAGIMAANPREDLDQHAVVVGVDEVRVFRTPFVVEFRNPARFWCRVPWDCA